MAIIAITTSNSISVKPNQPCPGLGSPWHKASLRGSGLFMTMRSLRCGCSVIFNRLEYAPPLSRPPVGYDKKSLVLNCPGRCVGRFFALPEQRLVGQGQYSNFLPLPTSARFWPKGAARNSSGRTAAVLVQSQSPPHLTESDSCFRSRNQQESSATGLVFGVAIQLHPHQELHLRHAHPRHALRHRSRPPCSGGLISPLGGDRFGEGSARFRAATTNGVKEDR